MINILYKSKSKFDFERLNSELLAVICGFEGYNFYLYGTVIWIMHMCDNNSLFPIKDSLLTLKPGFTRLVWI